MSRGNRKIRVGVIGLGTFGQMHTSILNDLPNVELSALCTRTEKKLKEIGNKFNVKKLYKDYRELIANPEVDAVFITSSEDVHAVQTMDALEAGKHVFVEKPLATSYKEGVKIVEKVRKSKLQLAVGYILRFEPRHIIVKNKIDRGDFGDIIYMSFKRSCSRSLSEGIEEHPHPVFETSTHDIDLAIWYCKSKVEKVYAKQVKVFGKENPEVCIATLTFENGIIATIETNWLMPKAAPLTLIDSYDSTLDSYFEVVGTEMYSRIRMTDSNFTLWNNKHVLQPEVTMWPTLNGDIYGALREEIVHFVNCIINNKCSPVFSYEDALYGLKVAEKIIESANEGKEISF